MKVETAIAAMMFRAAVLKAAARRAASGLVHDRQFPQYGDFVIPV
jgi:hypothetical protein